MILLASPCGRSLRRAVSMREGRPLRWVYLGTSLRSMRKAEARLGSAARRLGLAGELQAAARSLRVAYVDYIGMLGVEHDSPAWWFGSLSEKAPTISKAFLHSCYLAAAVELCREPSDEHALLFVVESRGVRAAVSRHLREKGIRFTEVRESRRRDTAVAVRDWAEMLARRTGGFGRHLWRMALARLGGFSAGVVNAGAAQDRPWTLLYNWVEARSFDAHGRYRDLYFGGLREELQKRGAHVAVVATVIYRSPYRRILAWLKRSGIPVLVPEAALTPGILWRWVRSLPLRPPPRREWPRLAGFDVSDILTETERFDWITTRAADVRLIANVVRQWSRRLAVRSFIYTYDGRSWERGYCLALRERYPQARLIGYQHSTISSMWLDYFISPKEWGRVPFPDRVVTNGAYHYDLLRKNGIPEQALACGGAIRYGALGGEAAGARCERSDRSVVRVLVTTSIVMTQAAELLRAAIEAFADPRAFRVTVKFHPCFPAGRVLAEAGAGTLPAHVAVVDAPVSELLRDADVLAYTDSTTAVEALAHGVPIVHFVSSHEIDTDVLADFDDVKVPVGTPEELRKAVLEVVAPEYRAARARRWREVVDLLLPPPDEKTIELFMPENVR